MNKEDLVDSDFMVMHINARKEAIRAKNLDCFAEESLDIEDISGYQKIKDHALLLNRFTMLKELTLENVCDFAGACGGELRNKPGMNVMVGDHVPIPGSFLVEAMLLEYLNFANKVPTAMHNIHHRFETLHPFTDGNGRTGRAIWLWQWHKECGTAPKSFLQQFYYQTLREGRG